MLASTSPALALPVGDAYLFTGYNLPDDNGPTSVTVDGVAENSGGTSINETVVAWNGVPGSILIKRTGKADFNNTDFSKVGQIVEFNLVRNTAGLLSDDPAAGFGFAVTDLDFGGPINLLDSTVYFYLTDSSGNPIPLTPTVKFLSSWGPNPLNLGQEVLYASDVNDLGDLTTFGDGKVSFDLAPSTSVTVNLLASVLGNPDIHGIRIGSLYTVPEPSSIVLAASGIALALVGARRARRRNT
jgi:hypothetical protein